MAQGEKLAELDQAQLENQKLELEQTILRLEQEFQRPDQRESNELNNYR